MLQKITSPMSILAAISFSSLKLTTCISALGWLRVIGLRTSILTLLKYSFSNSSCTSCWPINPVAPSTTAVFRCIICYFALLMTQIQQNIPLRQYNTLGIDAIAKLFASFTSTEELKELIENNPISGKAPLILGGGSNMLFKDHVTGL